MTPPTMSAWNLSLRFVLELGALAALAAAAWKFNSGTMRWAAVIGVPITAAIIWGVFNVLDDPSRSGAAPIEVAGWNRLIIEILILGGGVVALAMTTRFDIAAVFATLIVIQYATSWGRVEWLIEA